MAGSQKTSGQQHYELSQSLNERQDKQVDKLKNVIETYQDPFTFDREEQTNLINQTVMPSIVVHDPCNMTNIGQTPYHVLYRTELSLER